MNKDKQKQLLTEIMNEDGKDGLYKQQTAVEWLLQQIESKNGKEFTSYYTEFIEQAKEMEKEQIIKAASTVLWNNSCSSIEQAEQYYNETYKK